MKNVRAGAALFAVILTSSCSGGGSAVPPSAAPSNNNGAPGAASSLPPSSYHFTFVTAPSAPAGGIAVASDGRVYLNSATSFMRYDGTFTAFSVAAPSGYINASSGGVQSLALGPNQTVWEVLSGPLLTGGDAGAFAVLDTASNDVATRAEPQTPGHNGDFYNVVASGPSETIWLAHDTFTNYSLASAYQYGPADVYGPGLTLTNRVPACAGQPGCAFQTPFVAMTLGSDGDMYLATQPGVQPYSGASPNSSTIYEVNPQTGSIVRTVALTPGSQVTAMTAGPDGAIWFTAQPNLQIGRVSRDGSLKYFDLPEGSGDAADIAPGSDNALWFTLPVSNQIGRIGTDGTMTLYPLPQSNENPGGIAAGPLGACVPGKIYMTTRTGLAIFTFSG